MQSKKDGFLKKCNEIAQQFIRLQFFTTLAILS